MSPSPHSSHARAQAKLEHLLSLIQSTATEAMGIYAQSSAGVPSPDLLQPHPMDTIADAVPLKKALRVLEGACELLCTTLAQPMHTLMNVRTPYLRGFLSSPILTTPARGQWPSNRSAYASLLNMGLQTNYSHFLRVVMSPILLLRLDWTRRSLLML